MGAAVSSVKRAVRHWNATNRAIKHLEKEAKFREGASFQPKGVRNLYETNPSLHEKDVSLEKRVSSFNVISEGIKKNILPEGFDYVPNSSRKLPQRFEIGSPIPPPHIEFGFAIPEVIPKGKITMAQAINLVKSHQLNIKTVPQLAEEYSLDPTLVCFYSFLFTLRWLQFVNTSHSSNANHPESGFHLQNRKTKRSF
ncbi:hypothetical protein Aperf_G00000042432 [Anoplocephala perfoliata]